MLLTSLLLTSLLHTYTQVHAAAAHLLDTHIMHVNAVRTHAEHGVFNIEILATMPGGATVHKLVFPRLTVARSWHLAENVKRNDSCPY
jgi:hypothetical protein